MKSRRRRARKRSPRLDPATLRDRSQTFYSEIAWTALIPMLLGSFVSLGWDSPPNWLFTSAAYVLALMTQLRLFGFKHFEQKKLGEDSASDNLRSGLFLFGSWVTDPSHEVSEGRRLMELSKIWFQGVLFTAQFILVGAYLMAVYKFESVEFRFVSLIHLGAAIYLVVTTHKGHFFLALLVNLLAVALSMRTGSGAPTWAYWTTALYAIALLHALTSLHDYDLKQHFNNDDAPLRIAPNHGTAKTRRVLLDLGPIVLVALLGWKLLLNRNDDNLGKKLRHELSASQMNRRIQQLQKRVAPSIENILDQMDHEDRGTFESESNSGSIASDSSSGSGLPSSSESSETQEILLNPAFDPQTIEKELQALQNSSVGQQLPMADRNELQKLLNQYAQKVSGTDPALNAPEDFAGTTPQDPSRGGSADDLSSQLAGIQQQVEADVDPLLTPRKSLPDPASASASANSDDDIEQLNQEIEQTKHIRDIMKGFGKESPLKTLEKLQKLKMESPKNSLEIDPDNPELNEYAKQYSKQANELVKRFGAGGASQQQAMKTDPEAIDSQGGAPLTKGNDIESFKKALNQFGENVTDPKLKNSAATLLKKIERGAASSSPAKPAVKSKAFEKFIRLLPWLVLGFGLSWLYKQWKKLRKNPAEEEEDELLIEISQDDLRRIELEAAGLQSQRLSNEQKIIVAYNISLDLLGSLNFPKPDGMPAENFPPTFPRVFRGTVQSDFQELTSIFSWTYYGHTLVNDQQVTSAHRTLSKLIQKARNFAVQERQYQGEI